MSLTPSFLFCSKPHLSPGSPIILSILLLPKVLADPRNVEENSRVWSVMFVVLAVMAAIAGFLRTFCFSVSGEALTARLRSMSFKAIMRQVEKRLEMFN